MKRLLLIAMGIALLAGCGTVSEPGPTAVATLQPASGSSVTGSVTLAEMANGSVRVSARIDNVSPGLHGFHIHEIGDCSAPDATSAGAHFNPMNAPHAGPGDSPHHAGDFGNVTANAQGVVDVEFTTTSITVSPGPRSAVGRAIVLHADPDDLASQPAGAAGSRIACGIIVGPPA